MIHENEFNHGLTIRFAGESVMGRKFWSLPESDSQHVFPVDKQLVKPILDVRTGVGSVK